MFVHRYQSKPSSPSSCLLNYLSSPSGSDDSISLGRVEYASAAATAVGMAVEDGSDRRSLRAP